MQETTRSIRDDEGDQSRTAFEFLRLLLHAVDLSTESTERRARYFARSWSDSGCIFDQIARTLHRETSPHLVLTGQIGIGKSATVRELSRRCAEGEYAFLRDYVFLWFDCSDVGPEDSRGCLESLLAVAREQPHAVLCLNGFAALFSRPHGGTNKPLLRAAARRPGVRFIGLMEPHEYQECVGGDLAMRELFPAIELVEPNDDSVLQISRSEAEHLQLEFSLKMAEGAIQRAIALSSSFLFHWAQPGKTIKVLRRACEDACFEQTQRGQQADAIDSAQVDRAMAELTGIPVATFAGTGDEIDYRDALGAHVVGQRDAVDAVAGELRLIKAGLIDPGKPAGVLLFAGLTGVGKTELARRVAELYSGTRKLNIYTMGNFTEPHSVSGIIGVPPGYVGHEEGGRLVNELNSDPYSVFLLDEAEKAHPDVWKPFLNLFDEGWIVDQRGVKAYADRAMFILTTNAGSDSIAKMTRTGKSDEEIEERVKSTLSRVRHERSSQPVFTPQFLARIRTTVVFAPLDEVAMLGITRLIAAQVRSLWKNHRNKEMRIGDDLIRALAYEAYRRNEKSGGKEGGRIIRKLISDLVERRILDESLLDKTRLQLSTGITVDLESELLAAKPTNETDQTHAEPRKLTRSGVRVQWS